MKRVGAGLRWAGIVGLGLLASGCMQTAGLFNPPEPATTAPAVTDPAPVVSPKADKLPVKSAPSTPVVPKPATPAPGGASAIPPDPAPTATVKVATPAKVAAPAPSVTASTATGAAAATAAASIPKSDEDGFPNINLPPQQPEGALLAPDERKRIIDELEALRDRQNAAKPPKEPESADMDLKEQAATHGDAAIKQIEKCSAPGADKIPECQLLPTQ
jgi:hypothetical protein